MAKQKTRPLESFSREIAKRFGEISDADIRKQLIALGHALELPKDAATVTEAQYQLGLAILDVLGSGQTSDYAEAKQIVEHSQQGQTIPSQDALSRAMDQQGGALYKTIPTRFADQTTQFSRVLDHGVMASLNQRIQDGDLEAEIEEALGKQPPQASSFTELLGINTSNTALPPSPTD